MEIGVLGAVPPVQRAGDGHPEHHFPDKAAPGRFPSAWSGGEIGVKDYWVGPPAWTPEKPFLRSPSSGPFDGRYQAVGDSHGRSSDIQDKGSGAMVQNSGKTLCPDTRLRRINLPEPVSVEESASGLPTSISTLEKGGSRGIFPLVKDLVAQAGTPVSTPSVIKTAVKQVIISIEDRWRIDDEWWRSEPVSRLYYAVLFAAGKRLVIYKDLISGQWYKQMY